MRLHGIFATCFPDLWTQPFDREPRGGALLWGMANVCFSEGRHVFLLCGCGCRGFSRHVFLLYGRNRSAAGRGAARSFGGGMANVSFSEGRHVFLICGCGCIGFSRHVFLLCGRNRSTASRGVGALLWGMGRVSFSGELAFCEGVTCRLGRGNRRGSRISGVRLRRIRLRRNPCRRKGRARRRGLRG